MNSAAGPAGANYRDVVCNPTLSANHTEQANGLLRMVDSLGKIPDIVNLTPPEPGEKNEISQIGAIAPLVVRGLAGG